MFEMVRSCVTFNDADMLDRSVTDQATVPLTMVDVGNDAIMGHTITLLAMVVVPRLSHVSRNAIETFRL